MGQAFDLGSLIPDRKKQNEGVWFPVLDGDIQLLVASMRTKAFKKEVYSLSQHARKGKRPGQDLTQTEMEDITIKASARFLVKGWQHKVVDTNESGETLYDEDTGNALFHYEDGLLENGQLIQFSVPECERLLTKYDMIREAVASLADDDQAFQLNNAEQLAHKS